ncbi:MAG: hypothetical protein Q9166_000956 [cf. Caloplaca sp. 2 TL-2023]
MTGAADAPLKAPENGYVFTIGERDMVPALKERAPPGLVTEANSPGPKWHCKLDFRKPKYKIPNCTPRPRDDCMKWKYICWQERVSGFPGKRDDPLPGLKSDAFKKSKNHKTSPQNKERTAGDNPPPGLPPKHQNKVKPQRNKPETQKPETAPPPKPKSPPEPKKENYPDCGAPICMLRRALGGFGIKRDAPHKVGDKHEDAHATKDKHHDKQLSA